MYTVTDDFRTTERYEMARISVVHLRNMELMWQVICAYANKEEELSQWYEKMYCEMIPKCRTPFERAARILFAYCIMPNPSNELLRKSARDLERRHESFKNTLSWLLSQKNEPKQNRKAIQFLEECSSGAQIKTGSLAGELVKIVRYKNLVSALGVFLVEQCADKSSQELPFGSCARTGCGKFFIPKKSGRKRFCGDVCRARNFWTPQKRLKWRLSKLPLPVRRKRMRELADRRK